MSAGVAHGGLPPLCCTRRRGKGRGMGQVLLTAWAGGSLVWLVALMTRAVWRSPSAMLMRHEVDRSKAEVERLRQRQVEFATEERQRWELEKVEVKRLMAAQRVKRASSDTAIFRECPWCEQERHHLFELAGEGKPGRLAWWLNTAQAHTSSSSWTAHMLMPYELASGPDDELDRWELRPSWRGVWPWLRTCVVCGSEWGQGAL